MEERILLVYYKEDKNGPSLVVGAPARGDNFKISPVKNFHGQLAKDILEALTTVVPEEDKEEQKDE